MSWSGTRSQAISAALRTWLPKWVPDIEFFHSDDIKKGSNWHTALIDALRQCSLGIFCLTPEALQSPWLLFEAGALAQHGDRPTMLTYLYGIGDMSGPLAHFQHTRFERADTRRMVKDLAALVGSDADVALQRFDDQWPMFSTQVIRTTAVQLPELVPGFNALFDQRKTYYEPFPECSNERWDDRLRRIVQAHEYLSQPDVKSVLQSDVFLRQGHAALLTALDRYGMHVSSHLLEPQSYDGLPERAQRDLEDTRILIVDLVSTLRRQWPAPILAESPAFETESVPDRRKDAIVALQGRIRRGEVAVAALRAPRPQWALDRIAYHLACRAGLFPDVSVEDMARELDTEQALAEARGLVSQLEPLYYAAACVDERLPDGPDASLSTRVSEAIVRVERFLGAHPDRDAGGDIVRRLASMRRKLDLTS